MSIRIRVVNGLTVALCAARSVEKPGDIYLDDAAHHALAEKFHEDFQSEGYNTKPLDNVTARVRLAEESNNPNRDWWDSIYGSTVTFKEKKEWLILEPNKRCYWRENRRGYSGVLGAGLYTTKEADSIIAMGRGDTKVHITDKYVQAELAEARRAVEYFGKKAPICKCSYCNFECPTINGMLSHIDATHPNQPRTVLVVD